MTRLVLFLTLFLAVQPADPPSTRQTPEPPLAPPSTPTAPAIRFPELQPAPVPPAPPAPGTVARLTADRLYVVEGDIWMLFAQPAHLVKVTRRKGPWSVYAKFVDGGADYEDRTYEGKVVVSVQAMPGVSGRVELLVIPAGATTEKDAIQRSLDVGGGPAPDPIIPPGPSPDGPLGLVLSSWTGRQKVTTLSAADKARDAAALARSHRSIASAIAAGAYNQHATSQALAAAILADKKAGNLAVVTAPDGTVRTDWRPWGAVIDPVVGALYVAGRLNTKADWQAALEEIARGLD